MRNADIGLADRVLAIASLRPDDEATRRQLLAMLGEDPPLAASSTAVDAAAERPRRNDAEAGQRGPSPDPRPDGASPARRPPPAAGRTGRHRTSITRLPREGAEPTVPAGSALATIRAPHVAPLPVVSARVARAVMASLVARPAPGREPDVRALSQSIARGHPVDRLPMRPTWSLRRPVQLLVDCSAALAPLSEDLDRLERDLRKVVGIDRLQRLSFAGAPLRAAGVGRMDEWRAWQPPAAGTTLVVVSDFGCAGPRANPDWSSASEWRAFVDAARAGWCLPLLLTPYPVSRLPLCLRRDAIAVAWSERLNAGRVRRQLRDALRRA